MAADPVLVGILSFLVGAGVTYMVTRTRDSGGATPACTTARCTLREQCIAAVNDPNIPDYDAWLQVQIADDADFADACSGLNPIPPSTDKFA